MNKAIPIVILLIILGVVGATYMTSDSTDSSNMGFEDTVTILNDSEDIEEVNVAEIGEELNKNKEVVKTDNSSDILSKEEIKEAYEKIFSYSENATVDVAGPYKMDNGTLYYDVYVNENFDEGLSLIHIEADAKVKPEEIPSQNLRVKGALSIVYSGLTKDNNVNAKLSTQDIEKLAKSDMQKYYEDYLESSEDKEYSIDLYVTQLTNQPVYRVSYGPEDVHMFYDGNTGDLLYRDVMGYGYSGLYETLDLPECIRLGHIELNKYCEENNLPEMDFVQSDLGNYTNDNGELIYQFDVMDGSVKYGALEVNTVTQEVTIVKDPSYVSIDDNNDTVNVDEELKDSEESL